MRFCFFCRFISIITLFLLLFYPFHLQNISLLNQFSGRDSSHCFLICIISNQTRTSTCYSWRQTNEVSVVVSGILQTLEFTKSIDANQCMVRRTEVVLASKNYWLFLQQIHFFHISTSNKPTINTISLSVLLFQLVYLWLFYMLLIIVTHNTAWN